MEWFIGVNAAFLCLLSPLQVVSLARWIVCEGGSLISYGWDADSGRDMQVSWHLCTFWLCFSGMILSQHLGSPPGQCSLLLCISLYVNAGGCPDQADSSTDWWEKLSLSLSIPWYTWSLNAFALQLEFTTAIMWYYKTWNACLIVGKSIYLLVIDYSKLWEYFFLQWCCHSMYSSIQYSTD